MASNSIDSPRLPPLAQDSLDALTAAIPANEGFSYDRAYTILAEEEDLSQPAADDTIERLLLRGHLYEVDGQLRITEWAQANE
ncbi:hypothetical protein [Halomicrococcus sp. NG-SE-24]|uniref:hypothetical protein n=1 Tax=Halomicrococcus sp. NG-SE-24 TaxID=3436928 RepID=UPI003D9982A8